MSHYGQPLQPTGHRKVPGDSMPEKDAHANMTYFGPAGRLKSRSFGAVSGSANALGGSQGIHRLQKSRKRTRK